MLENWLRWFELDWIHLHQHRIHACDSGWVRWTNYTPVPTRKKSKYTLEDNEIPTYGMGWYRRWLNAMLGPCLPGELIVTLGGLILDQLLTFATRCTEGEEPQKKWSALHVGNGVRVAVMVVGTMPLHLPSGLIIERNNCYLVLSLCKNIISKE